MLPAVDLPASPPALTAAAELFREHGVLVLRDFMSARRVRSLAAAFFSEYGGLDQDTLDRTCARVGEARYLISVSFEQPFADPKLFAQAQTLALLRTLLGERCVLNSVGVVVAYPGAPAQHEHTDHPALFEGEPTDLPPYAITLALPLVELSDRCGGTYVWDGSHRRDRHACERFELRPQLGEAALVDYRTWHGGAPNTSQISRPILYLVYSRPWFLDAVNYYKQPPLRLSADALARVAPEHRALLVMAERWSRR